MTPFPYTQKQTLVRGLLLVRNIHFGGTDRHKIELPESLVTALLEDQIPNWDDSEFDVGDDIVQRAA